jgi:hypothetical protein
MTLLLLAFEAALYPTLLAAVVILLTLERPARLIAAYLAGGMTISVGLGLAIVVVLDGSNAVTSSSSLLSWTGDLVIGGLSLLAAVALALHADERVRDRRRRGRGGAAPAAAAMEPAPVAEAAEPKGEPWTQRLLARGSAPVVFVAALFVNVPGAAYLIALKDIAAGDHSVATVVALIFLFNVIMFLLAEIPLVGLLVAPERTGDFVDGMNRWLREHSRQLAIAICLTLGVFLIVRGLVNA